MSHRLAVAVVLLSAMSLSGLTLQFAAAEHTASQQMEVKLPPVTWQTRSEEKKKPTGACYINAGGIENCTSGMTRDACYKVATRVGGVADWREGERCK